jgi:hypothetical protein
MKIGLKIKQVKNIEDFDFNFDFENGIYALVGENAVGKSTVMSAIASTVYHNTLAKLGSSEVNEESKIQISSHDFKDTWLFNESRQSFKATSIPKIRFRGIYEGSIFSGTRFEDMKNIDKMIQEDSKFVAEFVRAHPDLRNSLSTILRNETGKYENLYKLRNMDVARKFKLNNMPYMYKLPNGGYISKYKMSSGECMLISLLNFINSTALKTSYKKRSENSFFSPRMFIFIDEVELALHPSSIVRLVKYLEEMCKVRELTVLFSSHSTELIKMIKPRNIFFLENQDGNATIMTPCYPHYAIRSLYNHDGNDCTVLVEDVLSEILVKKLLNDYRIKNNLLVNVLPVGSWGNTLKLQQRVFDQNIMGKNKFVFSILDGDVKDEVSKNKQFQHLRKLFLPIYSIEKFLYKKFIIEKDNYMIKTIGNKIFTYESLEHIINEYKIAHRNSFDKDGKKMYKYLLSKLDTVKIEETEFIQSLSEEIFKVTDFTDLKNNIEKFIDDNFHVAR